MSRKMVHAICLTLGGLGLISTAFATNQYFLLFGMAGVGIAWASILAMPYVILAGAIKAERMGVYMGVFNLFIVIPQIVMSFLVPQIYDGLLGGKPLNVVILGGNFTAHRGVKRLYCQRHRSAKNRKRRGNRRAKSDGSRRR